jgi:23S rRNA pseudouridine2605 synthase
VNELSGKPAQEGANEGIRLQKVLADAGVASRRACEDLIAAGKVKVDGEVVQWFGLRVDPEKAVIHVDGKRIPTRTELRYFALNKPVGVVSTMSDPKGRPTLSDYVLDVPERMFHVGRLDTDTEGLLLLTNDGDLGHRLMHPKFGVAKTYLAEVHGPLPRDLGKRLKTGIRLADGLARADEFRVVEQLGRRFLVEVTLHEGRTHIVRRLLADAGHPVQRLVRTDFGPVKLGRTKPGAMRALTTREVGELYAAVGL